MRATILALVPALVSQAAAAQTDPAHLEPDRAISSDSTFLANVRHGTARYRDRASAVRDGYRPVGPDAPAMGRHWVNISRVLDARFDPARPAILTYIDVAGEPVLVGVVFGLPFEPGDSLPGPYPRSAWHIHSGSVDDEGALFGHAMEAHGKSERGVAVLHVWAWSDNPDGVASADNWALPFLRRGLAVPDAPPGLLRPAALALSLPDGGAGFLFDVLRRHHLPDAGDRDHARRTFDRHAEVLRRHLASAPPDLHALADAWRRCWTDLVDGLTDAGRDAVSALLPTPVLESRNNP